MNAWPTGRGSPWREAHRRELEEVVAFARARELPLLVAVFPLLADAGGSRVATGRMAAVFREAGVPALDLTERVAARELADWVVNAMDAHPNERLHEEVAARLLPALRWAGIAERAAASFAALSAGR